MHRLPNPNQHLLQQDQGHPLQYCPIEHSLLWQGRAECGHLCLHCLVTLEPEIGSANRPSKGFFPVKKNHQQPRQVNALTVAHHKPSVPDHTLHEFVHTLSVTDHALTLADQYQFCLYNLCRGQVGQLHLSQGQDHGGGEGQYPQGTGTLLPIPSDINHLIGQNQASWGFSEI